MTEVSVQKLGLDHTKKVIAALAEIAVGGVAIVKRGGGFGSITKILGLLGDVKDLISEAPKSLPELTDLDAAECAELGAAAYKLVRDVVQAVAE